MSGIFSESDFTLNTLPDGGFLVGGSIEPNPMTIGWGMVGVMWSKRVFIAPVRESRFTKEAIDKSGFFSVSMPNENQMKKALSVCGTLSGRNFDKFKAAGLERVSAKRFDGVVIGGCKKYYECKVIAKCPLSKEMLSEELLKKWYPKNDLHTLYFGEILAEY